MVSDCVFVVLHKKHCHLLFFPLSLLSMLCTIFQLYFCWIFLLCSNFNISSLSQIWKNKYVHPYQAYSFGTKKMTSIWISHGSQFFQVVVFAFFLFTSNHRLASHQALEFYYSFSEDRFIFGAKNSHYASLSFILVFWQLHLCKHSIAAWPSGNWLTGISVCVLGCGGFSVLLPSTCPLSSMVFKLPNILQT